MIAGADASLKSFGFAGADGRLVTLRPRPGTKGARRLHELGAALTKEIRVHPPMPALVVLEGYALGSPGRLSLVRLGELGGVIRTRLYELGIAYVEIPPTALKMAATGDGAADKAAMVRAARSLGADPANDDEADAFLLRHIGRIAYGLERSVDPYFRSMVAAVKWPVL